MLYKIDWLSFTIPVEKEIGIDINFIEKLGYELHNFEDTGKSRFFYNTSLTFNNYVNIYYNSSLKDTIGAEKDNMLIMFTGQGCTELAEKWDSDWLAIFKLLEVYHAKVTRIDIALDDFSGLINFDKIERKLERREYRSSAKSYNIVKSKNEEGKILGRTIYIGKARVDNGKKGNVYARFYDKKAQYEETKQILPDHAKAFWQRYEISYSKEKANNIYLKFLAGIGVDEIFKKSLRNLLELLIADRKETNKKNWKVVKWWNEFLEFDGKITFGVAERDVDLAGMLDWLKTSVLPSIRLLELIGEERGFNVYQLLEQAKKPAELRKKQARLRESTRKIKDEELNKYLKKFLE